MYKSLTHNLDYGYEISQTVWIAKSAGGKKIYVSYFINDLCAVKVLLEE